MNSLLIFAIYAFLGLLGGLCGFRLKLPAGTLIGAMLFVILAKLLLRSEWVPPRSFGFGVQVMLGILVGTTFQPSLLQTFYKLILPIVITSVVLVGTGIVLAIIFHKTGLLDIKTGYIGTSPGAMSVLVVLAIESQISAAVITCFHLFRVILVILTAPLVLKFIE